MPCIDLPLEALKGYRGTNPRPENFDDFWNSAIQEVGTPRPEYRPAEFQLPSAHAADLYFQGDKGATIHAKCLIPHLAPCPAVLVFHGYTGRSPDWWSLANWVAAGFAVFAMDCRGQAGESEDATRTAGTTMRGHIVRGMKEGPDNLLMRSVYLDCAQLARIALQDERFSEVYVTGASQGGGLAIAAAALEPQIKKCASVYPFLSDYQRVWDLDLCKDAYYEIRDYLRITDPTHERVDDFFRQLGMIDVHHLAPRIKAKTLMLTGLMDTITPPSTQFAIYNNLNCEKEMVIYPDFGHEGLPESGEKIFKFFSS